MFRVRFILETIPLFANPRQQLKQLVLVIHFFPTAHERLTRLLSDATTIKSAATAPLIPALRLPIYSCITLAETIPPLLLTPICLHPEKASSVETCRVPLEAFEHSEKQGHHNGSIAKTTVVALLIRMPRHMPVVRLTQQILPDNQNWKSI